MQIALKGGHDICPYIPEMNTRESNEKPNRIIFQFPANLRYGASTW
jgi:hypothetical protein